MNNSVCIAKVWEESDSIPKIAIEEQGQKNSESKKQISAWRAGCWTKDKVDALSKNFDDHVDSCRECEDRAMYALMYKTDLFYCATGEELSKIWSQASTEYSWQPDFYGLKLGRI